MTEWELVVLHHAIAAFSDWREYRKIAGAKYWLEDTVEDGVTHKKCTWKEGVDMPLHVGGCGPSCYGGNSGFYDSR